MLVCWSPSNQPFDMSTPQHTTNYNLDGPKEEDLTIVLYQKSYPTVAQVTGIFFDLSFLGDLVANDYCAFHTNLNKHCRSWILQRKGANAVYFRTQ